MSSTVTMFVLFDQVDNPFTDEDKSTIAKGLQSVADGILEVYGGNKTHRGGVFGLEVPELELPPSIQSNVIVFESTSDVNDFIFVSCIVSRSIPPIAISRCLKYLDSVYEYPFVLSPDDSKTDMFAVCYKAASSDLNDAIYKTSQEAYSNMKTNSIQLVK